MFYSLKMNNLLSNNVCGLLKISLMLKLLLLLYLDRLVNLLIWKLNVIIFYILLIFCALRIGISLLRLLMIIILMNKNTSFLIGSLCKKNCLKNAVLFLKKFKKKMMMELMNDFCFCFCFFIKYYLLYFVFLGFF